MKTKLIIASLLITMSSPVFSAQASGTIISVDWLRKLCYVKVAGEKDSRKVEGATEDDCGVLRESLIGMNINSITVK